MRLHDGSIFPVPLPIDLNAKLKLDREVAIRDARNDLLGIMSVGEIDEWVVEEWRRKSLAPGIRGRRAPAASAGLNF
ncbi:MAG: PUA-like domain [Blastocatellia bacterium]|nr:PUA-like domain [Blastocatellia bacterium]